MKAQILSASKIVLVTFLFSAVIMILMEKVAVHIGAVDIPRSDEGNRHIHKKTTPKLGGVGIFLGFLFGYMLFGEQSIRMNSILIGSFIIILTGIVDDLKPIKAYQKLLGHIAAALVVTFYGGIWLDDISSITSIKLYSIEKAINHAACLSIYLRTGMVIIAITQKAIV